MSLREDMEELIDTLLTPWRETAYPARVSWVPLLDVSEDENSIIVSTDVPGMKPEELDISVTDSTMVIQGERNKEEEKKGKNYYRVEKDYGSFRRELRLPSSVETSKIKAEYKDGVLMVVLPKHEKKKPKKIKVNVN